MPDFEPHQAHQIIEGMEREGIAIPPVPVVITERTLRTLARYARTADALGDLSRIEQSFERGRQGLVKVYRGALPARTAVMLAASCQLVVDFMPPGLDRVALKSDRDLLCRGLTQVLVTTFDRSGIAA